MFDSSEKGPVTSNACGFGIGLRVGEPVNIGLRSDFPIGQRLVHELDAYRHLADGGFRHDEPAVGCDRRPACAVPNA
jgi:hypothetical protein